MKNKKLFTLSSQLSSKEGFTLMELLLTMAIIAILAGAILISLSSQRQKANQAKLLSEFSGVLQPMLMCRSDGESINAPNGSAGGGNICQGEPNYGTWPSVSAAGFDDFVSPNDAGINDGTWYFYAKETGESVYVCCNSRSGRCKQIGTTCDDSTDLTN
ncbi:MAG: type II secretion system protein [Patescibacteria group bacterium]|nr:type II secretion system protein [Patescibacteria group bacterium]